MSMLGRQSPDERDERLGGSRMVTTARKEENIYIPQFITKRPFYAIDESEKGDGDAVGAFGDRKAKAAAAAAAAADDKEGGVVAVTSRRDYLEHQRLRKREQDSAWYQRGKKAGPAATKYRKGACENCGSMGHKMRDCLSRPRAKLAKYSGTDIQADEVVQEVKLGWDAKRDRWLGFDARDYSTIVARREKVAEARRQWGEDKAKDDTKEKDVDKEDTRYSEDADMGVSRTNGAADLRMREDTARYLVNLDLDSAKYDPKRRKIVDGGAFHDDSARLFAEQNFARGSGDAAALAREERYAWEVHDKTGDASLHMQANPTAAAHRRRLEAEEDAKKREALAQLMRDKYGVEDAAATTAPEQPKPLAIAASEHFVEYDESGHVKDRLQGPRADRSKYAEDVLPMNHTSVWGSWWHDFRWGYACCHSFVRNSYCTGDEGKAAWERAERQRLGDWGDDDNREGEDTDDNGKPRRRLLTDKGPEEQPAAA